MIHVVLICLHIMQPYPRVCQCRSSRLSWPRDTASIVSCSFPKPAAHSRAVFCSLSGTYKTMLRNTYSSRPKKCTRVRMSTKSLQMQIDTIPPIKVQSETYFEMQNNQCHGLQSEFSAIQQLQWWGPRLYQMYTYDAAFN
jgi:hypothetical protein